MAMIKCRECGSEYSDQAAACPKCGCPTTPPQQTPPVNNTGATCPKCGSHNVSITMTQTNAKTHTKGNGCLWGIGRALLIFCTCGLWLLVGKHGATSKTSFSNVKTAVCQDCGNHWTVR